MSRPLNVQVFVDATLELYNLYQRLEVTDEVTEDDPVFDLMCNTCEVLLNTVFEMMDELVDVTDIDPRVKEIFAGINDNICSVDDLG